LRNTRFGLKTVCRAVAVATFTMLGFTAQAQSDLTVIEDQITYADHVAQIITDNCVVCHREGGVGPMQLTNFEQVRPCGPQSPSGSPWICLVNLGSHGHGYPSLAL